MKKIIKRIAVSATVTLIALSATLFIAWFILNIAMGCGMVNDWNHPACMTPIEMLRGE